MTCKKCLYYDDCCDETGCTEYYDSIYSDQSATDVEDRCEGFYEDIERSEE